MKINKRTSHIESYLFYLYEFNHNIYSLESQKPFLDHLFPILCTADIDTLGRSAHTKSKYYTLYII